MRAYLASVLAYLYRFTDLKQTALGPAALAPACLVAALAGILGVLLQAAVNGRQVLNARSPVPFGSFIAPVIFAFWMIRTLEDVPFWWDELLMR